MCRNRYGKLVSKHASIEANRHGAMGTAVDPAGAAPPSVRQVHDVHVVAIGRKQIAEHAMVDGTWAWCYGEEMLTM